MTPKHPNPSQKIGLGIALLALIAGVYSFWPHLTPPHPLAGKYLSKVELGISWIVVTETGNGQVTVDWNQMETSDKGVVKEHKVTLDGTVNGKDIALSKIIPGPKPVEVEGAGVREQDNIRMTLRADGRIFYTGLYEYSDDLSMVAALSDFNKNAGRLAQDWDQKVKSRATGGKTAEEQALVRRKMIATSNEYVRKMDDIIKGRVSVENSFRSNTGKVRSYLDNAKLIPGQANAGMRGQLVFMMESIAEKTQMIQDVQAQFSQVYIKEIVPFFASLTAQQKICTDAKARGNSNAAEESLCSLAAQAQQTLEGYSGQTLAALKEIGGIYQTEYGMQQSLIKEAKTIQ